MKTFALPFSSFSRFRLLVLAVALPVLASAGEVQAWLLLNSANPAAPESIMSTDVLEKNGLVRGGWKLTGTGILHNDEVPDSALVYRMIRPLPKGGVLRMLAVGKVDATARLTAGYVTEGGLGFASTVAGNGKVAVWRFTKDDKYLWLINSRDQNWATKSGWTRESTAFWLWADENP